MQTDSWAPGELSRGAQLLAGRDGLLRRGTRLSSILGAQDSFPQDLLSQFAPLYLLCLPFPEIYNRGSQTGGMSPFWLVDEVG